MLFPKFSLFLSELSWIGHLHFMQETGDQPLLEETFVFFHQKIISKVFLLHFREEMHSHGHFKAQNYT
jgi:hypothetical protein